LINGLLDAAVQKLGVRGCIEKAPVSAGTVMDMPIYSSARSSIVAENSSIMPADLKPLPVSMCHLRISQVESGVVRLGAVVHGEAAVEDRAAGHARAEQSFEVRLSRDKVIPVGDVGPPPHV
jgi:hypothetical protein